MRLTRMAVLSVIYALKGHLHLLGYNTEDSLEVALPYIKVMTKDHAYEAMTVPSIVVYVSNEWDKELQLGGGYWVKPMVMFDIYAENDAQLMELVDIVREFTESVWYMCRYDLSRPVYQVSDGNVRETYSNGNPQPVAQMTFENRTVTILDRIGTIGEMRAHSAQVSTVVTVPNA